MNKRLDAFNVGAWQRRQNERLAMVHQHMAMPDSPGILHHFTPELRLRYVGICSIFVAAHHHLHLTGGSDHEFPKTEETAVQTTDFEESSPEDRVATTS